MSSGGRLAPPPLDDEPAFEDDGPLLPLVFLHDLRSTAAPGRPFDRLGGSVRSLTSPARPRESRARRGPSTSSRLAGRARSVADGRRPSWPGPCRVPASLYRRLSAARGRRLVVGGPRHPPRRAARPTARGGTVRPRASPGLATFEDASESTASPNPFARTSSIRRGLDREARARRSSWKRRAAGTGRRPGPRRRSRGASGSIRSSRATPAASIRARSEIDPPADASVRSAGPVSAEERPADGRPPASSGPPTWAPDWPPRRATCTAGVGVQTSRDCFLAQRRRSRPPSVRTGQRCSPRSRTTRSLPPAPGVANRRHRLGVVPTEIEHTDADPTEEHLHEVDPRRASGDTAEWRQWRQRWPGQGVDDHRPPVRARERDRRRFARPAAEGRRGQGLGIGRGCRWPVDGLGHGAH